MSSFCHDLECFVPASSIFPGPLGRLQFGPVEATVGPLPLPSDSPVDLGLSGRAQREGVWQIGDRSLGTA